MYAIVDIETTGGNAGSGAITEVAIICHNGTEVEGRYTTLVNPGQTIPRYVQALTGITDAMVAHAPPFEQVAQQIYALLQGRIFVAHNVNFDYSFLHAHLLSAGIHWQAKKVCTIRYTRKVFPELPSYSLGNICRELGIPMENRHRAMGDALATTQLWERLLAHDTDAQWLKHFTKGRNPESYVPTHVPISDIEALPYAPGVYYFKDHTNKLVYVGKARNLKYRVRSHFTNNSTAHRKQEFLRTIHHIQYTVCATEMMASILEELEIKKHWPRFNRSQKAVQRAYGLYAIQDQRGFTRLAVEKWKHHLPALYRFHKMEEGFAMGRQLLQRFNIHEQLLFATGSHPGGHDAEQQHEHNAAMQQAITFLQGQRSSMLLYEDGENETGKSYRVYYYIRHGVFSRMGMVPYPHQLPLKKLLARLTHYPDNEMVKSLLQRYAATYPERQVPMPGSPVAGPADAD